PGETDALFEESRAFIESLPFTYLHVFTFSARPGTPAAEMPDQIPVHVARERNKILRDLASEKNLRFRQSFVGREVQAIALSNGEALTDNYLKLQLEVKHAPNQWLNAAVTHLIPDGLGGSTVHYNN